MKKNRTGTNPPKSPEARQGAQGGAFPVESVSQHPQDGRSRRAQGHNHLRTLTPAQRNRRIYEIRKAHPDWTYQEIGELVGISRQRVQQIVQQVEECGIIDTTMDENNNKRPRLDGKARSATQVARETGIPLTTIVNWVSRGHVKIVHDPGQTGPGKVVLLDPVSLQERIDRHRRRQTKTPAPA